MFVNLRRNMAYNSTIQILLKQNVNHDMCNIKNKLIKQALYFTELIVGS